LGPNSLAADYIRTHGRTVGEVMTTEPVTIAEETPLDQVVEIMERKRIKRVPVMRGRTLVGIVSRANLLRALASVHRDMPATAQSDAEIRTQVLAELARQPWAPIALI